MVSKKISHSNSANYLITVENEICPDEVDVLSNFFSGEIKFIKQDSNTLLIGRIKDQVALCSLMNYLTDLHYNLLHVNTLD